MDISRKYARAFFALYGDMVTEELIKNITRAIEFLVSHRRALFLLKVPLIERVVKVDGIQRFCDRFALGVPIHKLLVLLLDERRSDRFVSVLRAIREWYWQQRNIVAVTVASSCPLTDEQRMIMEQFIAERIAGIPRYTYRIDPLLIAGVRVYSDTLLWEFSIAKQLRDLYHAAIW